MNLSKELVVKGVSKLCCYGHKRLIVYCQICWKTYEMCQKCSLEPLSSSISCLACLPPTIRKYRFANLGNKCYYCKLITIESNLTLVDESREESIEINGEFGENILTSWVWGLNNFLGKSIETKNRTIKVEKLCCRKCFEQECWKTLQPNPLSYENNPLDIKKK